MNKDQLLSLTLRQLRQEASKLSVPLYSRKTKAVLVDLILKYQEKTVKKTYISSPQPKFEQTFESNSFNSTELCDKNSLREWCDNQSRVFNDKKFSDLYYAQLDSAAKKLSTFSKKIGKSLEDLEIDDLVRLVE